MKTEKIGLLNVLIYENIDEMPIDLYVYSNEYALLDYEIGNTPNDFIRYFQKMDFYLKQKKYDAVGQIRKNMHATLYNMMNHTSFKGLQFCCYIHSINGEKIEDYSFEGCKRILARLAANGFTFGYVRVMVAELKKKFQSNFAHRFLMTLVEVIHLIIYSRYVKESSRN